MTQIQLHLDHGELVDPVLPTADQEAVRDLARTCRDNDIPFRIHYPQSERFRYSVAARFTSR
jgi:hypothetical protein